MAEISREQVRSAALLSSTSRIEAPFVCVTIGGYTFGVYEGSQRGARKNGVVINTSSKYPNYINSLKIKKINGTVNQYDLVITYPITESNDPNFFEKIFSSVSGTRKITISYGDALLPEYVYRDEEAIITTVKNSFNWQNSTIQYTVSAVSASMLTLSGTYTFYSIYSKPSDEIKKVLYSNSKYHLLDVFKGMKDRSQVEQLNFIAGDDKPVRIPTCTNMSALEYISFLVSYMNPSGSPGNSAIKTNIYSITTYEDTSGIYGGAYFKVQKIQRSSSALNQLCTYDIDIGYPTANIITDFQIENDENWSLFYNYNQTIENSDYLSRIGNDGKEKLIYSPLLKNGSYEMKESDSSWWTQVTQYPVSATLTFKGLLKPVVLMQYVKLNVWFYGNKHISSGYYIITSQTDNISFDGYKTTLELLRVGDDKD